MDNEVIFAKGVYTREVKGQFGDFFSISMKLADFIESVKEHKDAKGYVHLILCQTKDKSKWFIKLDNWTTEQKEHASTVKFKPLEEEIREEDIPF